MQNRIKELREKRKLTQRALGARFKVPKDSTMISRWERGIVKPSSDNLLELANILNVKPADIFCPSSSQTSQAR